MEDDSTTLNPEGVLAGFRDRLVEEGEVQRPPERDDVLEGRRSYRLVERLGTGGFGSVWKAQVGGQSPLRPGEEAYVAVKIFLGKSQAARRSFLDREVSALLAVGSPNVPTVLDWGVSGGLPFMVQPYFREGSLDRLVKDQGPLDPSRALVLLRALLGALTSAHAAGLLHLDIKPGNVLLADDEGFLLTDFGIAQPSLVPRDLLPSGLGTRGYHAPEQRTATMMFDARTDLWGVGATVWSALTGINLARNQHLRRDLEQDALHGLPPLREHRAGIDPALEEIIMGLLRVDMEARPSSAAFALAQLNRLQQADPDATAREEVTGGTSASAQEASELLEGLMDPLWQALACRFDITSGLTRFSHGETILRQHHHGRHVAILLSGTVSVHRGDELIDTEQREGTVLGEISALTGSPRTAEIRAVGDVVVSLVDSSEFQRLLVAFPSLALRVMRGIAERLVAERSR